MVWKPQEFDAPEMVPEELSAWREATEVPDFAVAALQARVLAQVAEPRSRLPWWKWAVPVAAAAVLVAAVATRPNAPVPGEGSVRKAPVVVVPVEMTPAPEAPPEAPKVTQRVRRKPIAREASYIRYETPDPDVVILLIGSDGGGE